MVSVNYIRVSAAIICVFLVFGEICSAAPSLYADYDNLRDLYELLLKNEPLPVLSRYGHQMERKGGRSPSLRLRFGRRADPVWETMSSGETAAAPPSDSATN